MNNRLLMRDALAEGIGTFMLIVFGAGSGVLGAPLALVALANAMILMAIVATYGHISGAHVNPAITLGLLVGGKLDLPRAAAYWAAQLAGGLAGMLVLRSVIGLSASTNATFVETTGFFTNVYPFETYLLEGLFTFVLASVYVQTVVFSRASLAASLAIGVTFGACFLFGASLTGASINPVRTISLALLYNHLNYVPGYVLATLAGGALGGWVQCEIFAPRTSGTPPSR